MTDDIDFDHVHKKLALNAKEVGWLLGISADAVHNLHRVRALRGLKIGRRLRWDPRDVQEFMDTLRERRDP